MRKLRFGIVLMVCVLSVCGFCSAQEPAEATCVIRITSDPAVLPISYDLLDRLIESSPVGGRAIMDVFGNEERPVVHFAIEPFDESREQMMGGGFGGAEMMSGMPATKDKPGDPYGRNVQPMMMPGMTLDKMGGMGMPGGFGGGMGTMSPRPRLGDRTAGSEQTLLMSFQVVVEDNEQPVAEELMSVVVEYLEGALEKTHSDYSSRINSQLESAERQTAQAEEQFRLLQDRLREISGGKDLRHERIGEQLQRLNEKLSEEKMQLELDSIIVQDLAERIAQTKEEADKRLGEDSLTREIEEIIRQQIKQLENTEKLVEAGRADAMQLGEMQEKIVRTRIELANRRENLHGMTGSDMVNRLREEMAERSTGMTLARARLQMLERELHEKERFFNMADDYELTNIQIDVSRRNLQESMEYANDLRRRNRMIQPPMVSVIGAD